MAKRGFPVEEWKKLLSEITPISDSTVIHDPVLIMENGDIFYVKLDHGSTSDQDENSDEKATDDLMKGEEVQDDQGSSSNNNLSDKTDESDNSSNPKMDDKKKPLLSDFLYQKNAGDDERHDKLLEQLKLEKEKTNK